MRTSTRMIAIACAVATGSLLASAAIGIRDYVSSAPDEEGFSLDGSGFIDARTGGGITASQGCDEPWISCDVWGDDGGGSSSTGGGGGWDTSWYDNNPDGDDSTGSSSVGSGGGDGEPYGPITTAAIHDKVCGTAVGAALQITDRVIGTLPPGVQGPPNMVLSPSGRDWRSVEFMAAVVPVAGGMFGAFNNAIYTRDEPWIAGMPSPAGYSPAGIWHNHPVRGDADQRIIDRYPSVGDWNTLASIAAPGTDPSLWILGPDAITREFRLSERNIFSQLDRDNMINQVGLAGRERSSSCGG